MVNKGIKGHLSNTVNMPVSGCKINPFLVAVGVMYGVANANNAMKAMAKTLASGVEKKLVKVALTKGSHRCRFCR